MYYWNNDFNKRRNKMQSDNNKKVKSDEYYNYNDKEKFCTLAH